MSEKFSTVADLLGDPARWCQGEYAMDDVGIRTTPRGDRAVRWCLAGAVEVIYGYQTPEAEAALSRLRSAIGGQHFLQWWNDAKGRRHSEVVEACKNASV